MKKSMFILSVLALLLSAVLFQAAAQAEDVFELLDPENAPACITQRKLTDDEIAGLQGTSLDQLKQEISTFGDFTAWVRIDLLPRLRFDTRATSNDKWQYTFGAEFSWSWLQDWFTPNMTVSVAQYVLEDDIPGIETVCTFMKVGAYLDMKCACCIPDDSGYYLVNPELFLDVDPDLYMQSCAFEGIIFVSSLESLTSYSSSTVQILALDSADSVALDMGDFKYVPQDPAHVRQVYINENAKYPPEDSLLNYSAFGFPSSLSTESGINALTARALDKGTYEDAAAAVKTIPDVLNYLYYSGYYRSDGDLRMEKSDGLWEYNYKPEAVFRRGKGNCGSTAGLVAGLLEGDYDEVGMIHMRTVTYGHVINYIRDGNLYYVFDCDSWVGNNYWEEALGFFTGSTLEEAAMQYSRTHDMRQMVAFTNPRGGDCPIIATGSAVRLPARYCEYTVLQETPEEGFVYVLTDVDPAVIEAIDVIRGTW